MSITATSATDIGPRASNEDRLLVDDDLKLFAVADGMGGHQRGELAAQLAIERMREELARQLSAARAPDAQALCDALRRAIEVASQAIYERASSDASAAGMGATLTAALVRGSTLSIGHVGDSRAYLLQHGKARQLTNDHTMVGEMVRAGALTADEARRHPYRHVLSRAVGPQPSVEVETLTLPLEPGDVVVLATDGVCDGVDADALADAASRGPSAVLQAARAAGTTDNATVVLIEVATEAPASAEGGLRDVVLSALSRSIFRDLSFVQRAELLSEGDIVAAEEGQTVIAEGDAVTSAFVVVDGAGELRAEGLPAMAVKTGDVLGVLALVRERQAIANLVSTAHLRLLKITPGMLESLTRKRPWIGVKIYAAVADVAAEAHERAAHMVVASTDGTRHRWLAAAPPWDLI